MRHSLKISGGIHFRVTALTTNVLSRFFGKKKEPRCRSKGAPGFEKFCQKRLGHLERTRGLLFGLGLPGFDNILCRVVTKGRHRSLFCDFSAVFEDDGYELGVCLSSILNGNGFEAFKTAERRTDVSFAASSNDTGHPGNIGHVRHRRGGESCDGHRHGYN
jgi:hypothetical protein